MAITPSLSPLATAHVTACHMSVHSVAGRLKFASRSRARSSLLPVNRSTTGKGPPLAADRDAETFDDRVAGLHAAAIDIYQQHLDARIVEHEADALGDVEALAPLFGCP